MINKDMLKGIMLSHAQPIVQVGKDIKFKIGYYVRVNVSIRGNDLFLKAIQRSLLQYAIESRIKERESNTRPHPIMYIRGNGNLTRLIQEFIEEPIIDSHGKWLPFISCLEIILERKHTTQNGFDEIVSILESD